MKTKKTATYLDKLWEELSVTNALYLKKKKKDTRIWS